MLSDVFDQIDAIAIRQIQIGNTSIVFIFTQEVFSLSQMMCNMCFDTNARQRHLHQHT